MKKLSIFLGIIFATFFLTSCNKDIEKIKGNIVFSSYADGVQSVHFVDKDTLSNEVKVKVGEGYGYGIFKSPKGDIWAPTASKSDSTTLDKKIYVYDPLKNKTSTIELGYQPSKVFFDEEDTYVVCAELGQDISIYKVDKNLKAEKYMTVEKIGALYSADIDYDTKTIYATSLKIDGEYQYPMLTKIELKEKKSEIKQVSGDAMGISDVMVMKNKVFVGLADEKKAISVFDPKTLTLIDKLNYEDPMVGSLTKISDDEILISNFSSRMDSGSSLFFYSLKENKVTKKIELDSSPNNLSFIDGKIYVADNKQGKIILYDETGKKLTSVKKDGFISNFLKFN